MVFAISTRLCLLITVTIHLYPLAVSHQLKRIKTKVPKTKGTFPAYMRADLGEVSTRRNSSRETIEVTFVPKQVDGIRESDQKSPKPKRPNQCGSICCPGWNIAPSKGTCTKAACNPRCKHGGLCRKPQVCICKKGFEGPRCERRTTFVSTTVQPLENSINVTTSSPLLGGKTKNFTIIYETEPHSTVSLMAPPSTSITPVPNPKEPMSNISTTAGPKIKPILMPTAINGTSVRFHPLTVQELQSILKRKGLGSQDKMTSLLAKYLETQKSQMVKNGWKDRPQETVIIRTPQGEYTIHRQTRRLASGQVEKVKVMFTPMVCRVHCTGDRCTNHCERGNMTTVYSDEGAQNNGEHGFRAFLCPMICQNGGVCLKKDKCLCPPSFTGKFCQIPVPSGDGASAQHSRNSSEHNSMTKSVYMLPLSNHRPDKDGGSSIVNVHVQHPPEASVNIHQVERVEGHGEREVIVNGHRDVSHNALQHTGRAPLYRIQAQSSSRINGYTENSGIGYCFRRLENGQCAMPLPGLRTQDICCRGSGVAWGVHDCTPCPGYQGNDVHGTSQELACPKGFNRENGTCVDIDECQDSSLCKNGDCTNTRGSFTCVCKTGYLLDSSQSTCISHHVISEVKGPCFRILREGGCSLPILRNITKQICCCSRVGKAWGKNCEGCPPFGTEGFRHTCPAGPGYHYSASDLRINTRFIGHNHTRVPIQRQPGYQALPTASSHHHGVAGRLNVPDDRQVIIAVKPEDQSRISIPDQGTFSRLPIPDQTGPARVPIPDQRETSRVPVPDRRDPSRVPDQRETSRIPVPDPRVPARVPVPADRRLSPTERPRARDTLVNVPDTNMCESNPQICGPGRCVPRSGSYTCVCNNGYWLSTQGTHCIDMDECRQRPSPCANGRCENTVGSYRCACSSGFSTNPQGTECTDIDECANDQQLCGTGRCENTPGSYRCVCPSGFSLSPQGNACIDIDECRISPRRFCLNGRCENTPGSFLCVCPAGFTVNAQGTDCQDTDECRQTPRACGSGRCQNTPGSFRCTCSIGYRLTPQGNDCIDVNECENPGACAGQECLNTPGSFQCRQCRPGYRLQNRRCVDINECQIASTCGPSGKCINTDGSFLCECLPGFRLNGDNNRCTDINECLEGENCFPQGECVNTEGSYTCVCSEGYVTAPDGASCVDKDECQQGTLCQGGRCTNTQGSFQCACPTGFRATPDKTNCADIDECKERAGSICGTQNCENTLGSYRCIAQCDAGYRLTPSGDCADFNECANSTICGDNAECQNLIGSYRCTCNWGYEMSSEGQHCVDVDECEEYGESLCGSRRCENTPGSYKCITDCEPGFQLSPSGDCKDVNECLTLQGVCGMAICENAEGSFLCICPNRNDEFDPMTAKCIRSNTAAHPSFPSRPSSPRFSSVPASGNEECYYNLDDPKVCENALAYNMSQAECCCTVGEGFGQNCKINKCPTPGTDEYQKLCPGGGGYISSGQGYKDADECALFGTQLCKGGVCVNKVPGYTCYCSNGYYYDVHRLECVDNDECHEEEVCEGGSCINTVGSYYCTCDPPLVLDRSQRRCVTNTSQMLEDHNDFCWQEVGEDLVCKRPLLERQVTYTECCCLYGDAWGMSCAFCPARDSDDFEALCNVLRPPISTYPYEYGPEYGPGYGVPYGPDAFAVPPPSIVRPGYEVYPQAPGGGGLGYGGRSPYNPRDSVHSLPPFESPEFDSDLSYHDDVLDEYRSPLRTPEVSYGPRSLPSAPNSRPRSPINPSRLGSASEEGQRTQPRGPGGSIPQSFRPLPDHNRGPSETYEDRYERFEGLQAEECGILNGCENGRCIRVREGYTCDCYDGYRLDMTQMACVDINECDEAEDLSLLCFNGQCHNTDGSYECICPRGFVMAPQRNYCIPSPQ